MRSSAEHLEALEKDLLNGYHEQWHSGTVGDHLPLVRAGKICSFKRVRALRNPFFGQWRATWQWRQEQEQQHSICYPVYSSAQWGGWQAIVVLPAPKMPAVHKSDGQWQRQLASSWCRNQTFRKNMPQAPGHPRSSVPANRWSCNETRQLHQLSCILDSCTELWSQWSTKGTCQLRTEKGSAPLQRKTCTAAGSKLTLVSWCLEKNSEWTLSRIWEVEARSFSHTIALFHTSFHLPLAAWRLLQRRLAHAKPDFNWLSAQKWNLKAHMWYQLSPFPSSNAAIAMQHHPGNIHQSVATPRYSATPWYVLIQLPNVIDTISKRWRRKKAFNTSPFYIFP